MPIKQILSEQEAEHLRRQGLQVQAGDEVELNDAPQSTPTGSATDAASNAFMASSVPAAAGGLGFATGAALGVGLAPETGGLSLLLPLLFGGAGAYGGAKAGQAYTEAVLSDEAKQRLAMEAQQHPIASKVGSLATMPLGGMTPTPRSIVATLGGAGKLGAYYGGKMLGMGEAGASTAPVLTAVERQALINSAAGATLGPIQEAATAGLEGREITPGSLAESALIGAFANDATPILGKRMGFHPLAPGQMATEQGFRKTYTPPKIVAEPELSPQQIKEDFLKKNKQEGEEGAAPTEKLRMVEGPTSKQPELNFGEKSLVQEELPMYEIPPEVRAELKNEFSKLPPEAYSERWNAILPHIKGLGLSPEAIATLQKEVFGPKGIKLKVSDNLGKTPEGESPIGRYTPGGKTVEVAPRADAPAIPAHEGFHEQWFNMTPEEKGRFVEATKDELAQVNAERAKAGKKVYDPEEWFAMQGSVEHFQRGLNTRKESASQKWWNDTKAVFKQQFGKDPSADELLRAANFRLMNEQRGRFTPFGPAKDRQEKFATDDENLTWKPYYEQSENPHFQKENELMGSLPKYVNRSLWKKVADATGIYSNGLSSPEYQDIQLFNFMKFLATHHESTWKHNYRDTSGVLSSRPMTNEERNVIHEYFDKVKDSPFSKSNLLSEKFESLRRQIANIKAGRDPFNKGEDGLLLAQDFERQMQELAKLRSQSDFRYATADENIQFDTPEERRQEQEFLNRRATDAEIQQMWQKEHFRQMLQTVDEAPESRFATEDENIPNDYVRYNELQSFLKSKDVPMQDKMEAWKEIETIKNRNGGMPPTEERFATEGENIETNPVTGKPYSRSSMYRRKADIEAFGEIPDRLKGKFARGGQKFHTPISERIPVNERSAGLLGESKLQPEEIDEINRTINRLIQRRLGQKGQSNLPPNIDRKSL